MENKKEMEHSKQKVGKRIKKNVLIAILVSTSVLSIVFLNLIIMNNFTSDDVDLSIDVISKDRPDLANLSVYEACKIAADNGWNIDDDIRDEDNSNKITCDETNEMAIVKEYKYNLNTDTVELQYTWKKPDNYENWIIGASLSDACSAFESLGWFCYSAGIEGSNVTGSKYKSHKFDVNDPNAFVGSYYFFEHTILVYTDPEKYMELTGESLLNDESSSGSRSVIRR